MIAFGQGGRSVAFILLLLIGPLATSWAHAVLVDSTPKPNSIIRDPKLVVNLRFNVRVDGKRSRVRLVATDGTASMLPLAEQPRPDTLQTRAVALKPGVYTLRWQVLAFDGHVNQGEVPFTSN